MTRKETEVLEMQSEKTEKMLAMIEELVAIRKEDFIHRDKHIEEHKFLRSLIEREQARRDFWVSVANKVVSGGLWSLTVALTGAVLFTIKEVLKVS